MLRRIDEEGDDSLFAESLRGFLAISSLAAADKPIVSARLILPPTTSAFRSTCCVGRMLRPLPCLVLWSPM
jgi:hypothetical protein